MYRFTSILPENFMPNQLLSINADLEKDRFKGLEMREQHDTEKFT